MGFLPTSKQIHNYWVNEGPKAVLITIYVLINIALITERAYYYTAGAGFKYTEAISYGIPVARSTAAALRFNCALILLTVLRNFLSWLRGTWVGNILPIDKNIVFHIYLGWIIVFLAHTAAHMVNAYNIAYVARPATLVDLGIIQPGTAPPTPWQFAVSTIAGVTGIILTVCLGLMVTSAVLAVRGKSFEMFWFTHHLFVVFFIVGCLHGLGQLLEMAQFYIWVGVPVILYAIERIIRIVRGSQKTIVLQAIQHPSRVLELQLQKPTFKYRPGQYIFLQCPYVADYECSSPDEGFIGVHIRICGDWTGSLYKLLNPAGKIGLVQSHLMTAPNGEPIFLVDGPFGAASEEFDRFDIIMLWAAGIGVTPFASILKDLKHKIQTGARSVKRVEFYWTNRDESAFEWFIGLLATLEKSCPFLEINLFFTGTLQPDRVKAILMTDASSTTDTLTGLQARTFYGRPQLGSIFASKAQQYAGETVGVFYCGPPALSKKLYSQCARHTTVQNNTRFVYHKENF